jgi:predicted metal-dependent phosphoesterase TrpH
MNAIDAPGNTASDSKAFPLTVPTPGSLFADLHMHTLFSDGTFTPEELAARGGKCGLAAMALTDHDSVEGCARMAQACQALGMEFIVGTELTAEFADKEVHLLGYFLDPHNAKLLSEINKYQAVRKSRIHEMVARLNALDIPLRAETVFALANCRSPGRPHVARALVQEGLCQNMDEAFERFLKKGRRAWVPKCKVSALEAIALIHQAGGLAVMAHPGLNHCDEIIPSLAGQDLDGLECFHTKHTPKMSDHYLSLAARLNLLVTGGSDCHGFSKGQPLIGSVKLPGIYLQKLKAAHQTRTSRPAAVTGAAS